MHRVLIWYLSRTYNVRLGYYDIRSVRYNVNGLSLSPNYTMAIMTCLVLRIDIYHRRKVNQFNNKENIETYIFCIVVAYLPTFSMIPFAMAQ